MTTNNKSTPINANAHVCPQCHGTGKITSEVRDFDTNRLLSKIEMDCITCDGAGRVDEGVLAEHTFYGQCWCNCPESGKNNVFHTDGVAPWEWCTQKHHWHCAACSKLVQIG